MHLSVPLLTLYQACTRNFSGSKVSWLHHLTHLKISFPSMCGLVIEEWLQGSVGLYTHLNVG